MSSKERAQAKFRMWRENPKQFAYEQFKFEPDSPWQHAAIESLNGPEERIRLCLKACTGPGKTAVLAIGGWFRLACFSERGEHPKGAALSITRDNLKDNLWPEMAKWQQRSDFLSHAFTYTKEQIYANDHPATWFLSARSFAKDADAEAIGRALSGLHSRFPFILLDETGDMPTAVGRTAEQCFTGLIKQGVILSAGNPTSTNGLLYDICTHKRDQWKVITITADPDDPNRTPRVPIEFAREQIKSNGGRDNPWVMATILGLFPPTGFNSLVGIEDMEAAMQRHYRVDQYEFAPKILGVDVAREGRDRSIIAPRQGLVGFKPKAFRGMRSHDIAGHVANAEDKWEADGVIVDGTGGYGSGVLDVGYQLGRQWFDCQFAGKAFSPKFANKRAEIAFAFAEWIKGGGALPYLPELIREALAITYSFQGDKFIIIPKDMIRKNLGGDSTDYWDGYAETFAFPIAKREKNLACQKNDDYNPLNLPVTPMVDSYDPFGGR